MVGDSSPQVAETELEARALASCFPGLLGTEFKRLAGAVLFYDAILSPARWSRGMVGPAQYRSTDNQRRPVRSNGRMRPLQRICAKLLRGLAAALRKFSTSYGTVEDPFVRR